MSKQKAGVEVRLQRLFEDRQVGDYEWNLKIDHDTAQQDISDAEWMLTACREYLEIILGRKI